MVFICLVPNIGRYNSDCFIYGRFQPGRKITPQIGVFGFTVKPHNRLVYKKLFDILYVCASYLQEVTVLLVLRCNLLNLPKTAFELSKLSLVDLLQNLVHDNNLASFRRCFRQA